jgi:hypothetical protein
MKRTKARQVHWDEEQAKNSRALAPSNQSYFHVLSLRQAPCRYAISCISVLFAIVGTARYLQHLNCAPGGQTLTSANTTTTPSLSLPIKILPEEIETEVLLAVGPLKPQFQILDDVEVYYMLPKMKTTGMLIFFHGCQHSGQHLFILPEDRIVASAALNRGILVVSPTSVDRVSGCWTGEDVNRVVRMIAAFEKSVNFPPLPRMGIGASSGGAFLFHIYLKLQLKSMVSYVMGVGFDKEQLVQAQSRSLTLPATAYVHMPRDTWTAKAVSQNVAVLKAANLSTYEWKVDPHPLTPHRLCDKRLHEWDIDRCYDFFELVKKQQPPLLDPADSTVLKSYTTGDWVYVMQQSNVDDLNISLKPGYTLPTDTLNAKGHSWLWASLEEEIAVSYALHEMTAEYHEEVLDFLMAHAEITL